MNTCPEVRYLCILSYHNSCSTRSWPAPNTFVEARNVFASDNKHCHKRTETRGCPTSQCTYIPRPLCCTIAVHCVVAQPLVSVFLPHCFCRSANYPLVFKNFFLLVAPYLLHPFLRYSKYQLCMHGIMRIMAEELNPLANARSYVHS